MEEMEEMGTSHALLAQLHRTDLLSTVKSTDDCPTKGLDMKQSVCDESVF